MRKLSIVVAALAGAAGSVSAQCVDPFNAPPCHATIQAGVNAAPAAGTVTVAAATYFEEVTIPAGKDGLTIIGEGSSASIIDAGSPLSNPGISIQSNNVTIEGLGIRNSSDISVDIVGATGTTLRGIRIQGSSMDCVNVDGPGTTIEKSSFGPCAGECVQGTNAAANTFVVGNSFTMCESGAIDINADGAYVEKNKFSLIDDGAAIVITGNMMVVQKNSIANSDGIIVDCQICTNGIVAANKILNGAGDTGGIEVNSDAAGLIVEKNSVKNVTDDGFHIDGIGVVVRKNKVKAVGGDPGDHGFDIGGTGHTIEGNSASLCAHDGFAVDGNAHTLVENKSIKNLRDGFDVGATNCALTGNKAVSNLAEGIELENSATGSVLTENSATGNRTDFCDEAVGTTLTDNSFVTTGVVCYVE